MALRSDRDELLAAWRALAGKGGVEGWRTIAVAPGGPCRLLAGRRFPGNEEALLVGFTSARMPPDDQLPQGHGFAVSRAIVDAEEADRVWLALWRQSAGNLDLFTMMADDVVVTLSGLRGADDHNLLHMFLSRIRAWQDFMRRGHDGVLSPEAEVGLFGELTLLCDLVSAGLPGHVVAEAWKGPLDGIQDFSFGTGAIEVKATLSPSGFPATVGSLDQLDNSLICPIFLAAVRLRLDAAGRSLPREIDDLRARLREDPAALAIINSRLLHAGFLDAAADHYTRRFSRAGTKILAISNDFPSLTPAKVPIQIRKVRYEVDLDLVVTGDVGLAVAMKQLGVI